MNCVEFQRILPEIIDGGRNAEQEAHLTSCSACSGLVSDLNDISREARRLRGSEEPSPRVWNSIEIALRREGLIRQPQREPSLVSAFSRGWSPAWLLPVVAALLVAIGVMVYQRGMSPQPRIAQAPATPHAVTVAAQPNANLTTAHEDQQLLEAVGSRAPSMRAAYEANLQSVNAYIRDAEESAQADPNDEEAQQSLMDAYQQRATVYEMALDRSLP
jgi:hypothetical protein